MNVESVKFSCPICAGPLREEGEKIALEELLALWAPVKFRQETIEAHRRQSPYTQLFGCAGCDFSIFYPQIIGEGSFYDELQQEPKLPYYTTGKWDFDQALPDVSGSQSLIEIGCGVGEFLALAQPHVGQIVGTEYNASALGIARAKGFDIKGPGDSMEKLKGQFDIAVSFHVLEHVSDPVKFIEDMVSLVRPGGKIGIAVPNKHGMAKWIVPCVSDMPPHHASRWSAKTFEVVAKKLGLRIKKIAFEPLSLQNAYYLDYWIANRLVGNGLTARLFRSISGVLVPKAVNKLRQAGFQNFPLLHGVAMYVVLEKN